MYHFLFVKFIGKLAIILNCTDVDTQRLKSSVSDLSTRINTVIRDNGVWFKDNSKS